MSDAEDTDHCLLLTIKQKLTDALRNGCLVSYLEQLTKPGTGGALQAWLLHKSVTPAAVVSG